MAESAHHNFSERWLAPLLELGESDPAPETRLVEGDVVVVLGDPEAVTAAEERLLRK